ncbi:Rhodanese-related sulfurtransferase [hydrothermal vent metagenome]|uniref:Rhodanese-related sulfurtransferase n=1 Tax=hydrothermal vent metagenome TaxID=652676 RepID=A0A3B0YAL6_9ZZZZ
MKTFRALIDEILPEINEVFPWDLEEKISSDNDILLIDLSEPTEYASVHIQHSINVPRGILETSCDWGYEDTLPELANARDKEIILICRSGNRSALATYTMKQMGFSKVSSLKTGLRGWFDYEQPLYDADDKEVDEDEADTYFSKIPRAEQMGPQG